MASADKAILTGIRNLEIAHHYFFEAALKKNAIPTLEVAFTKIDFNSRDSVLASALAHPSCCPLREGSSRKRRQFLFPCV